VLDVRQRTAALRSEGPPGADVVLPPPGLFRASVSSEAL
jgi:hypothetical protein